MIAGVIWFFIYLFIICADCILPVQ